MVKTIKGDGLCEFAEHLKDDGKAERTIEAYVSDLQKFVTWYVQSNGDALTPKALTTTDVREYRTHMLRTKVAPSTINRTLASLRTYAEWAVSRDQLNSNPVRGIKGVEEQPSAPKWLEKREQLVLLREIEREVNAARTEAAKRQAWRDQALIILMMQTGLRVSEVCDLEMNDLALSERKGLVTVREGKGSKQREVPLNAEGRRVLKLWLEVREGKDCQFVFIGQRGEPLRPRAVQRLLADYGRRAGVEVTPHTLRHTFAKNLINAGVTLEKVAALLGHANLNTTRIYITPSASDLEKAVNVLAES